MEINVNVKVDLGTQALALLTGLSLLGRTPAQRFPSGEMPVPENAPQLSPEVKAPSQEPAPEDAAVGKTEAVEDKPAPTRKRRTAAEIEADKKAKEVAPEPEVEEKPEAAPEFSDLDADAQLEAIKAEVTRHTKKGKSADVKAMLAYFDAGRASELAEDQYEDFYNMVKEYAAGKSVNVLTSLD